MRIQILLFTALALSSAAADFGAKSELEELLHPEKFFAKIIEDLAQLKTKARYEINQKTVCAGCEAGFNALRFFSKHGVSLKIVVDIIDEACSLAKIETKSVCKGAVSTMADTVYDAIGKSDYKAADICGLMFEYCPKPTDPAMNWKIQLPDTPKPPVKPIPMPKDNAPSMRVLHLSDIHFDPYYLEGSAAVCKNPLCCRRNDDAKDPTVKAGKWGYPGSCDIPYRVFEDMLEHLNESEHFDYIVYTGDIPPHDIWNQSREYQLELFDKVNDRLKDFFPTTPIYSSLGNHESYPVNQFPQPFVKGRDAISWLYNRAVDQWGHWVNASEAQKFIAKGGFYSVRVKPGLKIISMNTNYCNNQNYWLFLNLTDPADELEWLIDELQDSEDRHELVHLISHIPPKGDCIRPWRDNFYNILSRYESTVRAQFYGHSHTDWFYVTYDPKNHTHANGVSFIPGSLTTYSDLFPGYRVYTIDGDYADSTFQVLDFENYIANITESNLHNTSRLQWVKEYSAKDSYGLENLQGPSWDGLWREIQHELTTNGKSEKFDRFFLFNSKSYIEDVQSCNAKCQEAFLCDMQGNSCSKFSTPP